MREEKLIKKLKSVELPEIQLQSHQCRLKMALLDAGYLKDRSRLTVLDMAQSKVKGGIDMIRGLVSRQPVWARCAFIAVPAAVILLTLLLLQSLVPSLGPQGVMAAAHAATAGLQSYRMSGSITSTFNGETVETVIEMKFAAPDRFHTKITIDGAFHEFIIIGDKQFIREPDNDQPGRFTVGFAIAIDILSREKTLELLGQLTDLERLPDQKIDGVNCFHYRGRVVEEEAGGMRIEVELWIGKDDYLIRQMKMEHEEIPLEDEDIGPWGPFTSRSVTRFYDFNEPIEIKPPKTACGELLPGWRLVDRYPREQTFRGDVTFTVDLRSNSGDDPAHQQISAHITIANVREEAVSNVRVSLITRATNEERGWMWNSSEPVTLEPGEYVTYEVTWEFDAGDISKEELSRLVDNQTRVLVSYTTPEGERAFQPLFPSPAAAPSPPEPPS
ncbi:TPA: hypothetical protein DD712_05040 [Candidatus Acetothermia bacterium]|nr:hypothetical protein [Candidatus Acetothermia bacterium]